MPGRRSIPRARASGPISSTSAAGPVGPLHGIPLAVKDIIATKTMPTTCGSPIYRDHVVGKDAACVTQLVKAGAIVLGKAVTTEFAGGHANKTHNPHNLRHTPAGSSSGSAAAVADFMAPIGYGTQTAGSVIRPGAFNGVVAYKGTFGWADMTGHQALCAEPRHAGLLRPRGQRPRPGPRRLRPRPGRSANSAAAHRPLPDAVVGRGRAFQPEEPRDGGADPALGRCTRALVGDARELAGAAAGAEPADDQGGDAGLCPRAGPLPAPDLAQPHPGAARPATR